MGFGMRMAMRFGMMTLAMIGLAAAAQAEPLDGKSAKKALFASVKAEVEILPEAGLPKDQALVLKSVGTAQLYYGAIAISPEKGLMFETTVAAANYHDVAAASAAALAGCNAAKRGKKDCVVAAVIRPKGWKVNGLSLSSDATAGFKSEYKMAGSAMAISAASGAWGIGVDGDAAIAACVARNAAANDCAVVIAN